MGLEEAGSAGSEETGWAAEAAEGAVTVEAQEEVAALEVRGAATRRVAESCGARAALRPNCSPSTSETSPAQALSESGGRRAPNGGRKKNKTEKRENPFYRMTTIENDYNKWQSGGCKLCISPLAS